MRVLVCGGRDFIDAFFLRKVLGELHSGLGPFLSVIEGDARGADRME